MSLALSLTYGPAFARRLRRFQISFTTKSLFISSPFTRLRRDVLSPFGVTAERGGEAVTPLYPYRLETFSQRKQTLIPDERSPASRDPHEADKSGFHKNQIIPENPGSPGSQSEPGMTNHDTASHRGEISG